MFKTVFKQGLLSILLILGFCFQTLFSETGGLFDRPVSIVLVCEPPAKTDKTRYYKSTSLFFKRLKAKRTQENGTAFLIGYGAYNGEVPVEQLVQASQNGYDLYIFPKSSMENLPSSGTNPVLPWISFLAEKKEIVTPKKDPKSFIKKRSKRKSKRLKSKKEKQPSFEIENKNVGAPSKSQTSEGSSENSSQPQKEESVSQNTSETKNQTSTADVSSGKKEITEPKVKSSKLFLRKKKTKKEKSKNSKKESSNKKTKSTSTIKNSEKKGESSTAPGSSQTQTSSVSVGNASFELSFDSLKFWFSTLVDPKEIPLDTDKILFLAGEKSGEEWASLLSEKTETNTWIQLWDQPQDLRFNEGIYYTGCAASSIPNGISVLNFFFRGNRLIRLKQESFSLNSDGSGKSWELE
ncbi:hypothetical protein AB3N59_09805 [Leptospira sp. WS92.C1]